MPCAGAPRCPAGRPPRRARWTARSAGGLQQAQGGSAAWARRTVVAPTLVTRVRVAAASKGSRTVVAPTLVARVRVATAPRGSRTVVALTLVTRVRVATAPRGSRTVVALTLVTRVRVATASKGSRTVVAPTLVARVRVATAPRGSRTVVAPTARQKGPPASPSSRNGLLGGRPGLSRWRRHAAWAARGCGIREPRRAGVVGAGSASEEVSWLGR